MNQQLQKWLSDAGLTQIDAARKFGITQAYLSQLLLGRRRPSLGVAFRIAGITRLSVDDLFPPKRRTRRARRSSLKQPEANP